MTECSDTNVKSIKQSQPGRKSVRRKRLQVSGEYEAVRNAGPRRRIFCLSSVRRRRNFNQNLISSVATNLVCTTEIGFLAQRRGNVLLLPQGAGGRRLECCCHRNRFISDSRFCCRFVSVCRRERVCLLRVGNGPVRV
jgi:hypothetical protein